LLTPMSDIHADAAPAAATLAPTASAAPPLRADDPIAREPMQFVADPLADATVAAIIGAWASSDGDASGIELLAMHADHFRNIGAANALMSGWTSNATIDGWTAPSGVAPEHVSDALVAYLRAGKALPDWADPAKVARAEAIFMEQGPLSCLLLFCASLPECYVLPDLAAVLHMAGQLEQHTEYRIRSTAAMIFPVMMQGGMMTPEGAGVAQTLKVRLIHATIRNLILRRSPEAAVAALQAELGISDAAHADSDEMGVVPPLAALAGADNMHQALFAHGWKLGQDGLPCNQEELAYTLLTFSYIFLRGMRRLGLPLKAADEDAYLHAWNVMAHILGIRRELMPQSYAQAETMFNEMQARGRADQSMPGGVDPRPALGQALMKSMEDVIPWRIVKPFPTLLTRFLCGREVARDIGIDGRVSLLSRGLFFVLMLLVRGVDWLVRLVLPEFSISRLISRVVGYQFMAKFLMDQTRPLKLPNHLLGGITDMMSTWSEDPKAPGWMNRLEDRMTVKGDWTAPAKAAATASGSSGR